MVKRAIAQRCKATEHRSCRRRKGRTLAEAPPVMFRATVAAAGRKGRERQWKTAKGPRKTVTCIDGRLPVLELHVRRRAVQVPAPRTVQWLVQWL